VLDTALKKSNDLKVKELLRNWGPAWLVMIADVDAASAITASESGATYGTKLIWFLLLLTLPLYVIQEVAGRVGAATAKGLGESYRGLIHRVDRHLPGRFLGCRRGPGMGQEELVEGVPHGIHPGGGDPAAIVEPGQFGHQPDDIAACRACMSGCDTGPDLVEQKADGELFAVRVQQGNLLDLLWPDICHGSYQHGSPGQEFSTVKSGDWIFTNKWIASNDDLGYEGGP